MEHTFYLVDVFAEGRYSGNQLAVFRNASSLSVEDMRHLAREVHFSETAFILSDEPRDGGFDLRVFTPLEEIPFSGHAVLGAAWVLQRELMHRPVDSIRFNLGAGSVQADLVYRYGGIDTVWVNHLPPQFLACPSLDSVAAAIGLDVSEIDTRWPVQEVSTGLCFAMVPLRSLLSVRRAKVVADALSALTASTAIRALYLFASETYDAGNDFHARMFAPSFGIPEDPATGAGAGCLVAYALRYLYPDRDAIDARIEQGYEVRRPSILFARGARSDGGLSITVGGRVMMAAQGHFV